MCALSIILTTERMLSSLALDRLVNLGPGLLRDRVPRLCLAHLGPGLLRDRVRLRLANLGLGLLTDLSATFVL